jgi:phosphate transport system substrate-binding protein
VNRLDLIKDRFSAGLVALALAGVIAAAGGCGKSSTTEGGTGGGSGGAVLVDGSSTVSPISSAVAEDFKTGDLRARVNAHGTGGGFKMLANGEIDICGASRPIKEEEVEACKKAGIDWIELPIAYDGLSVLVNPENNFVEDITTEELKKIWERDSKVKMWSDVRPEWPKEEIKLYGPGTDSGTFDYFTEEICGEKGNSRTDYQPSENDNELVTGVAGDKYAMGYFGYSYYEQNKDKLKLLKVNGIAPSAETVRDGTYKPLSRPLFIYVNLKSIDKPGVKEYVTFYLTKSKDLITEVGYVPLPDEVYPKALEHFEQKKTGPSELLPPRK